MNGLRFGISMSLGVVFFLAGTGKLVRRDFAQTVAAHRVLPDVLSPVVASVLPWLELGIGVLLLVGTAVHLATALAVVLLVAFASSMIINLLRGRRVECGCGWAPTTKISWWLVGRNGVLAALGIMTLFGAGPFGVAALVDGPGGVRSDLAAALVTTSCAWLLIAFGRHMPQLIRAVERNPHSRPGIVR